jgi:hypothetical protein
MSLIIEKKIDCLLKLYKIMERLLIIIISLLLMPWCWQ